MQALLGALLAWMIRVFLVRAVVKVLFFLGIGITSYVGVSQLMDYAESELLNAYNSLPGTLLQFLVLSRVDYAISVLLAGFSARASFGLATRFGPRLTTPTDGA